MASARIRVASLNVWALPATLVVDRAARMRAIGERIADLAPDIAAFQEVWTAEAAGILIAAGRKAGLVHHWMHHTGITGSGLLLLTRFPIQQAGFHRYEARGRPERIWHGDFYAGKGFGDLVLAGPTGALRFLVTHLHAAYRPDGYDAIRLAQTLQFAEALGASGLPLIAAGDFNLQAQEPHYGVLTLFASLRDVAEELEASVPTVLANNPYRSAPATEERIDYLFARDGADHSIAPLHIERSFDEFFEIEGRLSTYSDHAGLLADFEVRAKETEGQRMPGNAPTLARARAILRHEEQATAERSARRRAAGGAGLLLAAVAALGRRREAISRRRFLRSAAGGVAALGAGAGIGELGLGVDDRGAQRSAIARALHRLDTLAAAAGHGA